MRISLSIELLSPVNVRSAYDLAQLDPSVVSQVTVILAPEEPSGEASPQPLELTFDHRRLQFIDLVDFVRAIPSHVTPVELRYQGRTEHFEL